jgi:hypothetical protein
MVFFRSIGIMGSKPLEIWIDVLAHFYVSLMSCVGTGLSMGQSGVRGVLPNVRSGFFGLRILINQKRLKNEFCFQKHLDYSNDSRYQDGVYKKNYFFCFLNLN